MDWSSLDWWQLVLAVAGGSFLGTAVTAAVTLFLGRSEFKLKRRVETLKFFGQISTRAQGHREDHPEARVGTSEQIAAMYLLAELANEYEWLRPAVVSQLDDQHREFWYSHPPLNVQMQMSDDQVRQKIMMDAELGSTRMKASMHRDRMVAAVEGARAKITKADPPTPFPKQKVYLGELGPYWF